MDTTNKVKTMLNGKTCFISLKNIEGDLIFIIEYECKNMCKHIVNLSDPEYKECDKMFRNQINILKLTN